MRKGVGDEDPCFIFFYWRGKAGNSLILLRVFRRAFWFGRAWAIASIIGAKWDKYVGGKLERRFFAKLKDVLSR